MESKGVAKPIVFCLAVFAIFGPTGSYPFLGIENLLEVLMWREDSSVGPFRGENEIHGLFPHFDPLSPHIDIWIFIAKYRQITSQSTLHRMWIIFMILTLYYNDIKWRNIWGISTWFSKNTKNKVKTANFSLSLLFFSFSKILINIGAYLNKHRHLRINKSLDWGHY